VRAVQSGALGRNRPQLPLSSVNQVWRAGRLLRGLAVRRWDALKAAARANAMGARAAVGRVLLPARGRVPVGSGAAAGARTPASSAAGRLGLSPPEGPRRGSSRADVGAAATAVAPEALRPLPLPPQSRSPTPSPSPSPPPAPPPRPLTVTAVTPMVGGPPLPPRLEVDPVADRPPLLRALAANREPLVHENGRRALRAEDGTIAAANGTSGPYHSASSSDDGDVVVAGGVPLGMASAVEPPPAASAPVAVGAMVRPQPSAAPAPAAAVVTVPVVPTGAAAAPAAPVPPLPGTPPGLGPGRGRRAAATVATGDAGRPLKPSWAARPFALLDPTQTTVSAADAVARTPAASSSNGGSGDATAGSGVPDRAPGHGLSRSMGGGDDTDGSGVLDRAPGHGLSRSVGGGSVVGASPASLPRSVSSLGGSTSMGWAGFTIPRSVWDTFEPERARRVEVWRRVTFVLFVWEARARARGYGHHYDFVLSACGGGGGRARARARAQCPQRAAMAARL
jgi:hypothetical protein